MSRYLTIYSTILTMAFVASASLHFVHREAAPAAQLSELTLERLNVVEADGTLRLVLANTRRFPGLIMHRTERPHPNRKTAGMLFFNEEGTENGGLIFDGKKTDAGVAAAGSLTFDAYDQDQVVQIIGTREGAYEKAGMIVSERPSRSTEIDLDEEPKLATMDPSAREALMKQREESGYYGRFRLFVGRERSDAVLALADGSGRPRMLFRVGADGTSAIEFRDAAGNVVRRIAPE